MPKEIPTRPDTSVIFAQGEEFAYLSHKEYLSPEKKVMIEFLLSPTPGAEVMCELKYPDDYNSEDRRFIKKSVEKKYCIQINSTSYHNRWIVLVDWFGKVSDWLDAHHKMTLEKLEYEEMRNIELSNENARLHEDLNMAVSHPDEFDRKMDERMERKKKIIGTTTITGGNIQQTVPEDI